MPRRPTCPLGINLRTYNIQDSQGFGLPQTIQYVRLGNYDLMMLTEKKIPDESYCHNHLGCYVVCS